MRKLLSVAILLLALSTAATAQEQIVVYGYSYLTPPEAVGTVTTVVGFLEAPAGFTLPLTLDFVTNEYTFYYQATIASIVPGAFTTNVTYTDATFSIYEDPLKNGNYGTAPPNGTSPSTYTNGTLILTGTLSEVTRINFNFGFPEPTIVGNMDFTGGTRVGDLPSGGEWTFHGGLSANPLTGIPSGYFHTWATKIIYNASVRTEETTWGRIKGLYAGR